MSFKHTLREWHKTSHEQELARREFGKWFAANLPKLEKISKSAMKSIYPSSTTSCYLFISKEILSFYDLLPTLELLETFGEIKSTDDTDGGRRFQVTIQLCELLSLTIMLTATPAEGDQPTQSGRRCRKIVVGTNSRTYSTPIYAIQCD